MYMMYINYLFERMVWKNEWIFKNDRNFFVLQYWKNVGFCLMNEKLFNYYHAYYAELAVYNCFPKSKVLET